MRHNKYCGICGAEKYHNGKRWACRPCRNKKALEWQKVNKERANAKNRRWASKNKLKKINLARISKVKQQYNLTEEQYALLIKEHDNKCAICGREERIKLKGTLWSLSIDHCHKTGKIRGLLCAQCNVGIAKFDENIIFFQNAIKYLIKHQQI